MKKIVLLFLVPLIICASSCSQKLDKSYINDTDIPRNIELILEMPSENVVKGMLYNKSDETITCDNNYSFEINIDDSWFMLPVRTDYHFSEDGRTVEPNKSTLFTFDFSILDKKPSAGKYRVVKTISIAGKGAYVFCIFNIKDDGG